MSQKKFDVVVVGTGMGALSAACLLAKANLEVLLLEQNYLIGGCTSSYWRKGFVFESGATTLVGLGKNMPLQYLLDQTQVEIEARHLENPMQIHLKNGQKITRHENLEKWIAEAENAFGKKNQRKFWEFCYQISQFVWETSLKQRNFPPANFQDLWHCAKNSNLRQFYFAQYALRNMDWLLEKFDLAENQLFRDFVNEQLIITAQNHTQEVNVLFGATALCYTNFPNYYVNGGLINLVEPLANFVRNQKGSLHLRESVKKVVRNGNSYSIETSKGNYESEYVVFGIPLNNVLEIYAQTSQNLQKKAISAEYLNSAFQMGIGFGFEEKEKIECIHHQIHLETPLPYLEESKSIFLSLSHPADSSRTDQPKQVVASISTHLHKPAEKNIVDKKLIENAILEILEQKGFLERKNVVYTHSSTQHSWEKWTNRAFGFVGGYPQFQKIKPWQMVEARLDKHKAYLCGDTAYPGQGIAGAVLSGIIAFEKLKNDWLGKN